MRLGAVVIAGTLLTGWAAAGAQTLAPVDARPKFAAVDAAGRTMPSAAPATERIKHPDAGACGAADALTVEAARALVQRVATEEHFYPEFVLSVAKIESRYDSKALSDKNAFGLMQLTAETAARFNVDRCNPEPNVRGGVRYLRFLHERYRNPLFILAAYNAGEDAVLKSRGVPPFPETVRFVADVLNDFYSWPDSAPRARLATKSLVAPVIIEPNGDSAPAQMAAGDKPARENWGGAFVLHVQ
ncbi:lytic transglycosylase domain-containing protein (plasmid) [Bradyrhizobium sp. CCGUVB1N3]|uniref:lytic transglycosylase domain-containing protein n=1 Tax=Bradyrhizobium sp. CCGUVB1N3 TaxID=2949629 RepID=UPI0020B27344|nr:lytic transglycosylase domain-containing protein [Bradyrhizobium sp. CCGUVB1N3]MCP3477904.1 lytic transglycosylase domain-containing protein [Bradyrhizobium sp. CCGUVB1N3]